MIKANEIRIDNLLFYDTGESIENNFVDWEDIKMCYVDNEYFNEHYSPIPLTEDWLVRLGFISNPYQDRYEFGDIDIECDNTKGETILWASGAPHIKYVHQVQNLVHALTGKELELKPE